MRNLLIALTGFLAGTGLVLALVLPLSQSSTTPVVRVAPPHMSGGMSGMGSSAVASGSLATRKLTIVHVQRGCHVWSNGKTTGAMMKLHLQLGQKLSVLDQDVDAHQMVELAGPMRLHLGGPMMTNHGMTLRFTKLGVYRLGTKTVEMKGMAGGMDVKTIGSDNKLRLMVTVA
jgi:hypothetical protein